MLMSMGYPLAINKTNQRFVLTDKYTMYILL